MSALAIVAIVLGVIAALGLIAAFFFNRRPGS